MSQAALYIDCQAATMTDGYGLINDCAVVVERGKISWIGQKDGLPQAFENLPPISLGGRLVTPAFTDCHTHLVFGGDRASEFEMRFSGASYEEIARAGGGIISTVKATREVSDEELLSSALSRLDDLIADGVAVVEVKSGYGLTIEHEMRMLRITRQLETLRPVKIKTTWLAAHALPPEYKDHADDYIDEIVITGLTQAHDEGLVDAVDGFCENIGFTTEQIRRVFKAAKALNLPVKLHAEQLSDQKGALLAAEYGALSADHLEYLAPQDVPAFAKSGAVAVLLPGAFYTLRETQLPPFEALRDDKVSMAVATDCNPGSSPISSLLTTMNMACIEFKMTPEEVLSGVTKHAAKALGMQDTHGTLEIGKTANLAIWDVKQPAELCYWVGRSPLYKLISQEGAS